MKFIKMHGLGNDFMVIDAINQRINLSATDIIALGKRDTGVGFDQCLLVEQSTQADIDFFYRIFNADGHEVGQCGNGARCLARFIHYLGLSNRTELKVATKTTTMTLKINTDETVTVNMGYPLAGPSPFTLDLNTEESLSLFTFDIGNPHAVTVVSDIESTPVQTLGKTISEHPAFPHQTNAGFMEKVNSKKLKLRVYERGCGETKACGSGAVAAAAVGRRYLGMDDKITVSLPGGDLRIEWQDSQSPLFLTGPATFVYEGFTL